MSASLSAAMVKTDDADNLRLVKGDAANNTGRDDDDASLVLASGLYDRSRQHPLGPADDIEGWREQRP